MAGGAGQEAPATGGDSQEVDFESEPKYFYMGHSIFLYYNHRLKKPVESTPPPSSWIADLGTPCRQGWGGGSCMPRGRALKTVLLPSNC
eukprot:COSAG01_NODE_343_length_18564_cov_10.381099_6_plen_89_part_00